MRPVYGEIPRKEQVKSDKPFRGSLPGVESMVINTLNLVMIEYFLNVILKSLSA